MSRASVNVHARYQNRGGGNPSALSDSTADTQQSPQKQNKKHPVKISSAGGNVLPMVRAGKELQELEAAQDSQYGGASRKKLSQKRLEDLTHSMFKKKKNMKATYKK